MRKSKSGDALTVKAVAGTHVVLLGWNVKQASARRGLGASPTVVTGSANFSEASTTANHENMLVIRGDRRVADIYLGEFMRSYSHHAFRESVQRNLDAGRSVDEWKPQFLAADASWLAPYFRPGSALELRREYFSGA